MLSSSHQLSRSEFARYIDHTLLKPVATVGDIVRLSDEAMRYSFWSVCVAPSYVERAVDRLEGSGVKVCAVIGFPLGFSKSSTKLAEAKAALDDGADEFDMVMNVGAFKSGDYRTVSSEIEEVAKLCGASHRLLKVIIECCYLTDEEKANAARMAASAGANFVKTSTGFGPGGATVADVALLRRVLGRSARVKAAGGIGTLEQALEMIKAGADRIGTSSGAKIMSEWTETVTI